MSDRYGPEIDDLRAQIESLGETEIEQIKKRLQGTARRALAESREEVDYTQVGPGTRAFLSAVDDLRATARSARKWSDVELVAFAGKLSGVMVASEMMDAYVARTASASFGCFDKCSEDLSRCFVRDGCDKSGWICLCCSSCYVDYLNCKVDCATRPSTWIELIKDQF